MLLTILTIIVVLAAIFGVLWTVHRQDELDERQDELDKYSTHLDERANILAADEATCREMNLRLRQELGKHQRDSLTWEDIKRIVKIADDLIPCTPFASVSEQIFADEFQTEQSYYEEVLKRFMYGQQKEI